MFTRVLYVVFFGLKNNYVTSGSEVNKKNLLRKESSTFEKQHRYDMKRYVELRGSTEYRLEFEQGIHDATFVVYVTAVDEPTFVNVLC